MTETYPRQDDKGRIEIAAGSPVMSQRSYIVRRLVADPMDRVPADQFFAPRFFDRRGKDETVIAVLFEDRATGMITADVDKFEKWMETIGKDAT